jgi:hypothetical protein
MKSKSATQLQEHSYKFVVMGGLQDGAEHENCPNEFSVGSMPGCDYLLIDCPADTVFKFRRRGDGFEVLTNGEATDKLLALNEPFSMGGCQVKFCLPVDDSNTSLDPAVQSDLVPLGKFSGLMKTRSGVFSVVGVSLMGVALTAALATSVLGESDDQALQSALASHGAKNVFVNRDKGAFAVKAQFDNEANRASFAAWMNKRMGPSAKLTGEVKSQQVVSTTAVAEAPKLAFATPMESAFGCNRDCFDPAAISMIRVGKVARVYFSNGTFMSVGDRIAKGVYIEEVAAGTITVSNGEKTVTLVVE